LIDLWRQEEFLRSLDINAKKTAMLNISKQMINQFIKIHTSNVHASVQIA